jgi:hypothetical protein
MLLYYIQKYIYLYIYIYIYIYSTKRNVPTFALTGAERGEWGCKDGRGGGEGEREEAGNGET